MAEEHPHQLASQHELARAYQANGQIKQAVEPLEHMIAAVLKASAEEHPNQLTSQRGLVSTYQAHGQIKKAAKLLKHAIEVESKSLVKKAFAKII